ncbi:hypothetical protein M0R45_001424 [Rubus argutus]|uniref:Uncharacterized protein n=1 Tax=Rubus argutus TaxID=59490 RepID=A0AAW1VM57_RUBAR
MGMRGAAARLGLGLGGAIARDLKHHKNMMMIKKVSSSFSPIFFIRKSSSASSSVTEKGGTGLSSDKWLYLYFNEHYAHENVNGPSSSGTKYPIRAIKLSYLLSPTKTDYEHSKLTEAVRTFRNYNSSLDRNWAGHFSSQILFTLPKFTRSYASDGGNNEICPLETQMGREDDHQNPKLKKAIKRLKKGGQEFLFLEELPDGKLYSLYPKIRAEESERFQVLDTTRKGRKKWLPLEAPPPLNHDARLTGLFPWPTFIGVPVGTKVLVWYPGREGAYCFDVTQPEKGWLETAPSLGSCIPSLNCFHPLFVEHEHEPGGNNQFLMFSFDPYAHDTVKVFLLSPNWDTFQPLNQPLVLPKLPFHFWDDPEASLEYHFVHLGPQKVCLVLHSFFFPISDLDDCRHLSAAQVEKIQFGGRNKGDVVFITFEYEITNLESLEIQYRVLTTRHYEYTHKRASRGLVTQTIMAELAHAAVV